MNARCMVRGCPDGDDFNDICAAVALDVGTVYADERLTRAMLGHLARLCPTEEVIRVVGGFYARTGVFVHGDGGIAISCLGPGEVELYTFRYLQQLAGERLGPGPRPRLRLVTSQPEVAR
jgi:hypothetical protein